MTDKPFVLDLDAQRAARQEIAGDPPAIVIGGKRIEIPRELALRFATEFMDLLNAGDVEAGLRILLKPDAYDQFMAADPTVEDLAALTSALPQLYGLELGKSDGSPASSASGGTSSRRTSKGTTASTSGKRSRTPASAG